MVPRGSGNPADRHFPGATQTDQLVKRLRRAWPDNIEITHNPAPEAEYLEENADGMRIPNSTIRTFSLIRV
jgi:hypothetical protein